MMRSNVEPTLEACEQLEDQFTYEVVRYERRPDVILIVVRERATMTTDNDYSTE